MCGIAGMRRFDGSPVRREVLRAMAAELVHRGPDDEGYWTSGAVGFGHRRLSIIDLAGSPQPMASADGKLTVCFNGEIFNYQELRTELAAAGHTFRTGGDTEVLLAVFAAEGERGVRALEGQFAYAMHDAREDKLWLFRDRMGVLPLYYHWDGSVFLFASEVKSLLAALDHPPAVDELSLKDYLAHRSVPWPDTLFAGIKKLPPGHRLCLDAKGRLEITAYWSLPAAGATRDVGDAEAVALVRDALTGAVANRLVADVPVGAYLSGGVDSSLIVALMTKLRKGASVATFSAGFGDPRYDELPYALEVSRSLGTVHHPVIVSAADFEQLWSKLTWHRDAPLSEPADIAIYKLAALARGTVKVLLSGEGSDELFGGYPKYAVAAKAALADWLPGGPRRSVLGAVQRLLPEKAHRLRIALRAMAAASEADRFQTWFAPFTGPERDLLLPGPERGRHREIWGRARGDLLDRMLYVDCHTWLVDNLLERGDRMAMAASVESRPPFMDHRLVELAMSLRSGLKVRGGRTKWIVKEVARTLLPPEIVDRKKVGFRVPLDAWFRSDLKSLAHDLLLAPNSFVSGRMDRPAIEGILRRHSKGQGNEEIRIWTLLCLEVWHQVFFKKVRAPDRAVSLA